MAYTSGSTRNNFPTQAVSDLEKISYDYGLQIAKAIEQEWYGDNVGSVGTKYYGTNSRYSGNQTEFHRLRLYARGEQSIQKYKDELSINGDLSYLNLDWKPVPIIPKFVDIVVNGMADKEYEIKAYSQDPFGVEKRTKYMNSIIEDMQTKEISDFSEQAFGINIYNNDPKTIPQTEEELQLHMQLEYKQAVELAEEQAINVLFDGSKYDLIKKRFYYDLAVLGIGAVKTSFNTSEGAIVEYVDPANLVYSFSESPYFDDIYYVGEIKNIPINELVKQFPHLNQEEIEDIVKNNNQFSGKYTSYEELDSNKVQVLYFNYKTYMNEVYKLKETSSGMEKIIEKDDSFNPPEDAEGFSRLQRAVEVLYEGAFIVGTDKLLKWEISKNMLRPKSDFTKVKMNYSIVAPRMYKGKIESLVGRITSFADMIQLTHLKLQQVMSRMVPDGVYLDADGLAEIDLGNGTNYNPQEALNMFFQTGSVIGRSFTQEGDMNPGKVPIQAISGSANGGKINALISNYNYYLQMIRDVTGLNEARDGSTPDKNALVGLQKLAAANSNTATRHILQAGMFLTTETAEALSLRISDILEYSPSAEAFIQAIGAHNVATLNEMKSLHLYDFGIFIELAPDEEQKAMLENNIQQALAQQNINLEDAIDLRNVRNVKLANQLLKVKRKRKIALDEEKARAVAQNQAMANAQTAQAQAQTEIQKQQVLMQGQMQMEQFKAQLEQNKLMTEAEVKKDLMRLEFQMNSQLKDMEVQVQKGKEKEKEDRKDERTRIQASQQSELIDQRKSGKPPKKFESSGNDVLGGLDMSAFGPR
jgi:hypothetical protein